MSTTVITSELSDDPGNDMYWNEHLVIILDGGVQVHDPNTGGRSKVEVAIESVNWQAHVTDYGAQPSMLTAFAAALTAAGFTVIGVFIAQYAFVSD